MASHEALDGCDMSMDQLVVRSDGKKSKPKRTAYDDELDRRMKQLQEYKGEK